jgi:hypothetical protein
MLPSGHYVYGDPEYFQNWFLPTSDWLYIDGSCALFNSEGKNGSIDIHADYEPRFTASYVGYSDDIGYGPCDSEPINLSPPGVGHIVSSGGCIEKQGKNQFRTAWVLFWNERYSMENKPMCTRIVVSVIGRKGRDGVTDAAAVVQMMLDRIGDWYVGDPAGVIPPTAPVYPSGSPSITSFSGVPSSSPTGR